MSQGHVKAFIQAHYRHFNAAALKDAACGYAEIIDKGGKMMVTLAGAMSTAELGLSLAEMIRQDFVHAITTTGANLEEDIFNLVAHEHYERVPGYRDLTAEDEVELLSRGMNRVTDTCIPEEEAMRKIEKKILDVWKKHDSQGTRAFPHEFFYEMLRNDVLKADHQIDPKNSWLVAACEKNLPIFTPGWEDSTLGNVYASHMIRGSIGTPGPLKNGTEAMVELANWYTETRQHHDIGFFQIGGGIAGDFPICVVPMLSQDLKRETPLWSYFCQISDSTTSYGSYSGAVPNEKITWGKLAPSTPKHVIESDATIVAPLIFAYLLNW